AIGRIPGGQIGPEMRYDVNAAKHFRQPVEVALVRETVAFHPVIAPFDATLAPPAQRLDPVVASADADPADVVEPEPALAFQPAGETMWNDAERRILHFIVDRI